ncbi:hypothetical protein HYS47_05540 [Candidatus Woesearchaeota archaeon]|nr:hypothetical protein [Candidatus Woesearchaeota archaeon]
MTIADRVKAVVSQPENSILLRNMNVVTAAGRDPIEAILRGVGYSSKEVTIRVDPEVESAITQRRHYTHSELPGATARVQSPEGKFLRNVPEKAGIRPTTLVAFSTTEWDWSAKQRARYLDVLEGFFRGLAKRDSPFGIYDNAGLDHDEGVKHYFEFS